VAAPAVTGRPAPADPPPHATVGAPLAEWRAVAAALADLAGLASVRPGLAAEIRAAVAAHERTGRPEAALALRPADAAVVRAVRAGLRRREAERTAADIEAYLGLPPRRDAAR
jgi:hypothetical protein